MEGKIMNENYDFAGLSGRYYAREVEFEKTRKKFLKIIKNLLVDMNSNLRNPPIEKWVYMCPLHRNLWVNNYKKGETIPMYYTWDRVCPDCFDEFMKLDPIVMLELFPDLRDMLE